MNTNMCPEFVKAKYTYRFVYETKTKKDEKKVSAERLSHLLDCDHPYCKELLNKKVNRDRKAVNHTTC